MSSSGHGRDTVFDERRLAAVRSTRLLDTGAEGPFDRLTQLAATALDAPFAFVTIVDDTRSFWKSCFGVDSDDPAERQNLVEESFCQYVVRSDAPLVVGDAPNHPVTQHNPSIESMGVRAWAGWPIRDSAGNVLGTFCAVDVRERAWTEADTTLLSTLAGAAASEIQLRIAAGKAELEAEQLRSSLLPPSLPDVPGLDIAAVHRSASGPGGVLGDFYDVFRSTRDRWHILLGDVCGSGVEAASLASLARWSYHALAEGHDDPADIFPVMNDVLRQHSGGRFLTMQALAVESRTGSGATLRFASAGHHPAVLLRASGATELIEANGWMLGAFDEIRVGACAVALEPGDQLVSFTDGLTEARPDGRRMVGHPRVAEHLRSLSGLDAEATASALVELALDDLDETRDDVAVLVIGLDG